MGQDDPFFEKIPHPVSMPEIIPVQALSEETDPLWHDLPRPKISPRRLWALITLVVLGVGGTYLAVRSPNQFHSTADQATPFSLTNSSDNSRSAPPPATVQKTTSSPLTAITSPDPTCALPQATNQKVGFQIGQPTSWLVGSYQGLITVSSDQTQKTVVFLLPIRLLDINLRDQVTKSITNSLIKQVSQQGGQLAIMGSELTGVIDDTPITGFITSRLVDNNVIVAGGWSASSDWLARKDLMLGIAACYQTIPGTILQKITKTITDDQDTTTFNLALPESWIITNLYSSGFDLHDPVTSSSLSFYVTSGVSGNTTLANLLETSLARSAYQEVKVLADGPVTEKTDIRGLAWQNQTRSFIARAAGQIVRGTVTVALSNADQDFGYGTYTALTAIRIAELASWSNLEPYLAAIQTSCQIVTPRPGQGLILSASDPASERLPFSGAQIQTDLVERVGDAAQLLLATYQDARAADGDQFLAPLTSLDSQKNIFIYYHGDTTQTLFPTTVDSSN